MPEPGWWSSWMYIATLHCGYVFELPRGLMTGRSIPSASTTTRVATRFGFALADGRGVADSDAPEGGSVGRTRLAPGSWDTIVGGSEALGSAAEALPV